MLLLILYICALNIYNTCAFDLCDKCIQKCCPENQYVSQMMCKEPKRPMTFDISSYPVFNYDLHDTAKKVKDNFKITPGKFENETFRNEAVRLDLIRFNIYLIEDGSLTLEMPNSFERWTKVLPYDYCIDFVLRGKVIRVWAVLEEPEYTDNNVYMTTGMIISCVFLALVLVVYSLLRELRNLYGKVLMAYVTSLLFAFMLLTAIKEIQIDWDQCIWFTLSVYYFFIATFCWMNVMSYDIWWTFRGYAIARSIHRHGEFKFCMYCLYGFGVPLAMTIFMGVINSVDMRHVPWFVTPNIPLQGCFLVGGQKLLYMYVPMLIMNVLNWVFFLMTAFNIWRQSRGTAVLDTASAGTPAAHRSQRHRLMVYLKLSIIMGLNWVLEVASSFKPNLRVWYITDAFNALLGVSIFLIFVCKKKIIRRLAEVLRCCHHRELSAYFKRWWNSNTESKVSQDPNQISLDPKVIV